MKTLPLDDLVELYVASSINPREPAFHIMFSCGTVIKIQSALAFATPRMTDPEFQEMLNQEPSAAERIPQEGIAASQHAEAPEISCVHYSAACDFVDSLGDGRLSGAITAAIKRLKDIKGAMRLPHRLAYSTVGCAETQNETIIGTFSTGCDSERNALRCDWIDGVRLVTCEKIMRGLANDDPPYAPENVEERAHSCCNTDISMPIVIGVIQVKDGGVRSMVCQRGLGSLRP